MSKKDKGRIEGQFVALRYEVMDCPAYIATSHGARCLLLALKRRVPRHGNRAYLSYRMARSTRSRSGLQSWNTTGSLCWPCTAALVLMGRARLRTGD